MVGYSRRRIKMGEGIAGHRHHAKYFQALQS